MARFGSPDSLSQMRVLLKNTETKLYFAGSDQWTQDTTQALDFEHIDRAVQAYTHEGLAYAEIVLEPGAVSEMAQSPLPDEEGCGKP
jgi:hypothetical protein